MAASNRFNSTQQLERSLIIFQHHNLNIEDAFLALSESLLISRDRSGILFVRWDEDLANPVLYVELVSGLEAEDIICQVADKSEYELDLNTCNALFVISFDRLDEVLDDINTLIEVQLTLQDLTSGYLYNTWNENLSPPPIK